VDFEKKVKDMTSMKKEAQRKLLKFIKDSCVRRLDDKEKLNEPILELNTQSHFEDE
jgi:transcriptional regulator of aromatic amino acid metabolism